MSGNPTVTGATALRLLDGCALHHATGDRDQVLTALAQRVVRRFARSLPAQRSASPIDHALDHAIMTAPDKRDPEVVARLDAVAGRVLPGGAH